MQFGKPGCVESQLVGQLDLSDGVLVALRRRLVFRARQLVENAELRGGPLIVTVYTQILHHVASPHREELVQLCAAASVQGKREHNGTFQFRI